MDNSQESRPAEMNDQAFNWIQDQLDFLVASAKFQNAALRHGTESYTPEEEAEKVMLEDLLNRYYTNTVVLLNEEEDTMEKQFILQKAIDRFASVFDKTSYLFD